MLRKNLEKYIDEYDDISTSSWDRIVNYLSKKVKKKSLFKDIYEHIKRIDSIKQESIRVIIYAIPEATPRPRMGLYGHFYVKNANSNNRYMELVVNSESDICNLITTPCTFHVDIYQPIPKSMNIIDTVLAELGLIKPITTPDWDNLGKTYSDMVQKHLLLNDSLITDGSVSKRYSLKPRIEITITYLVNYDCQYNKKVIEHSKSYKEKDIR